MESKNIPTEKYSLVFLEAERHLERDPVMRDMLQENKYVEEFADLVKEIDNPRPVCYATFV
ncbi:MAG: hypothetical protein WCQ70_04995 [Lentimicrobiaceae bacterium]